MSTAGSTSAPAIGHHTTRQWFASATVRNVAPPRLPDDYDWTIPAEMRPLLGHPRVAALPTEARRFLSVQTLHKYLHDICLTETDVVNRVAQAIAYNQSAIPFPAETCAQAFSIIVDEAFHSYVARLMSLEVERVTGISPVPLPVDNPLVRAYEQTRVAAGTRWSRAVELLTCCLSESTFTKEILAATRLDHHDPTLHRVLVDHLHDEGRHFTYFRSVLKHYWATISEDERLAVSTFIPQILGIYFDRTIDREFDRALLLETGSSEPEVTAILTEIYGTARANPDEPRLKNSLEFLGLAGVLAHPAVRQSLADHGLLPA